MKTTDGAPRKKKRLMVQPDPTKAASKGRHEFQCRICAHPEREEIELAFVAWTSADKIAEQFSVSRDGVYRHAHMFGLMDKRRRNVRAALERIIEKAGEIDVNAAAVVAAISAYARINSRGEWVERTESVNLNDMFQRMTAPELDAYAKSGSLPEWFQSATAIDSHGGIDVQ